MVDGLLQARNPRELQLQLVGRISRRLADKPNRGGTQSVVYGPGRGLFDNLPGAMGAIMRDMTAYLGGTFDILHPGHIKLFRWAKRAFGKVYVAVNTDEFIERYKGKAPAMNFEQRVDVLRELRSVDGVVTNTGDEDSKPSILTVMPDVIVVGSDWTRERIIKQLGISEAFLEEHTICLIIYSDSDPIHSSDIKKRMA